MQAVSGRARKDAWIQQAWLTQCSNLFPALTRVLQRFQLHLEAPPKKFAVSSHAKTLVKAKS